MSVFPSSVASDGDLHIAKNNLATTLAAAIDAVTTTILLTDASQFPTAGYVTIDSEAIRYTSVSGNNLLGVIRGADGTTATSHLIGAVVSHNIVADHHNVLKEEIKAIEQKWSDRFTLTDSKLYVSTPYVRVGIGTTSPEKQLHLYGGNSEPRVIFEDTANRKWYIGSDSTNSFKLVDMTAGVARMIVDGGGNTSFGGLAPGHILDVVRDTDSTITMGLRNTKATGQGDAYFQIAKAANGNSNGIQFYTGTSLKWVLGTGVTAIDDDFKLLDSSNNRIFAAELTGAVNYTMYLKQGKVGIGTNTPTSALDVVGTGEFNVGGGSDGIDINGTSAGDISLRIGVSGATSNAARVSGTLDGLNTALLFKTGGSERVRIDGAGNVGIGTSTPAAKFQVRTEADHNLGVTNHSTGCKLTCFNDAGSANALTRYDASAHEMQISNVTSFKVDGSTTSGETRMLVYDVDNGTLERVTVGAADSGGTGYKVLRIPN